MVITVQPSLLEDSAPSPTTPVLTSGDMTTEARMASKRVVRILLECLLVEK